MSAMKKAAIVILGLGVLFGGGLVVVALGGAALLFATAGGPAEAPGASSPPPASIAVRVDATKADTPAAAAVADGTAEKPSGDEAPREKLVVGVVGAADAPGAAPAATPDAPVATPAAASTPTVSPPAGKGTSSASSSTASSGSTSPPAGKGASGPAKPAPKAAPVSTDGKAKLTLAGDKPTVYAFEGGGQRYSGAMIRLPPGSYTIYAGFGTLVPMSAGTLTVAPGAASVVMSCSAAEKRCKNG